MVNWRKGSKPEWQGVAVRRKTRLVRFTLMISTAIKHPFTDQKMVDWSRIVIWLSKGPDPDKKKRGGGAHGPIVKEKRGKRSLKSK